MFCRLLILATVFLITKAQFNNLNPKSPLNYGPYKVRYENYSICRGPKSVNVANCSMTMTNVNENYKALINITMYGPTTVDEVKLTVYIVKETTKTVLWNHRLDKPCQHFVIAGLIAQFVKNNNCMGKKGTYSVELDFTEISKTFFGTSFFYGEFYIKALVQSKKGNILCLGVSSIFSKL